MRKGEGTLNNICQTLRCDSGSYILEGRGAQTLTLLNCWCSCSGHVTCFVDQGVKRNLQEAHFGFRV